MPNARTIALGVLRRVDRDQAFANLALDAELSAAGVLDPRDAALATELSYGVLRRRAALDAALAPLVKGGLSKLEDRVLDVLRLGAYQLLHTRVAPHAAVSESVAAAKAVGLTRAAGLVNAVLRRLSREGAPPAPDPAADPRGHLVGQRSLPAWLADALLARLGPAEAVAFADAVDGPAPACLRVNRTRGTRDEVATRLAAEAPGASVRAGALAPDALLVERAGLLARLPSYREGLWSQQDEAAQLVTLLCGPVAGRRVLDACAAPGGKACHLAELGAAEVVAVDVHERKARRIGEEAARLGLSTVRPVAADASAPLPPGASGPFDVVLVDAPCTGLGTLRRHPELRYRRTPGDVARMVDAQRRILANVATHVRPGGVLVYAVCSVLAEEGPAQVDAFLAAVGGMFRPAPLDEPPPATTDGWRLETWPHRHAADGFFAARLHRIG